MLESDYSGDSDNKSTCALGHVKEKNKPCRFCRIERRIANGGRINRVNKEFLKDNPDASRRSDD